MVIPLAQSLEPKPSQPEPQLQAYELIKPCYQVSKCNGFGALLDKTGEKLYSSWRNVLEWHGKVTTTNKQYKVNQRNTYCCAKKKVFTRSQTIITRKVEIQIKSDNRGGIKMGIETDFGIKVIEYKE